MTLKIKKGQVALWVIVAIIIVGVILFLYLKVKPEPDGDTKNFGEIYQWYSSCIEQETRSALAIAGMKGGKLEDTTFIPGSDYMPFSSHLNFLGSAVPYWYYLSANGIVREQVPTKQEIEKEVASFVEEGLEDCSFDVYYLQGYDVQVGTPKVTVNIQEDKIDVKVNADLAVTKGNSSSTKNVHELSIASSFGILYKTALQIYGQEKNSSFLERYAEDALRLYAPVDGVEVSCSPKIWKTREVMDELKQALENNVGHIKIKGTYYQLKDKKNEYFVVPGQNDVPVQFIYSKEWPTRIEISGNDGELMIAKPLGNQPGLGVMGFCYAAYHFVYDLNFPVMVQVYQGDEVFQFPVAVVIEKNVPRERIVSDVPAEEESFDFCQYPTQDISVQTYDVRLAPINANVSYSCFDQECYLGQTTNGVLYAKAPACGNGILEARATGFVSSQQAFSSNKELSADIILDKEYSVDLVVKVDGKPLNGQALVSFDGSQSISTSLPDSPRISLAEGFYNVSVYVYGNSSIVIPASTNRQCTQVAQPGIFGFLGGTKEQCFDINIPETKIEQALLGGGISETYIMPSQLEKGKLVIDVSSFGQPTSLEKLQYNYEAFDQGRVFVE